MSRETYEQRIGKFELYLLLNEGIKTPKENKVKPFRDVVTNIQKQLLE